jgi:signal transduction histidine kinase
MRRPDARWAHAARVALVATAVVAAVTVILAVIVNATIAHRLNRDIDHRLAATLVAVAGATPGSAAASGEQPGGDVDDAPAFVWRVGADRSITALTFDAPRLPSTRWSSGTTTLATEGRNFRFTTTPFHRGWLVAGESVAKVTESRGDILLVELLLGALLLIVTFSGSFAVGLRASAPIELVRQRQAEFTADASHELRTPLSVIEAEVDLALARPREPAEYAAILQRIGSESGRLRSIVEDLLWLARADGPTHDARLTEVVDLSTVAAVHAARFAAVADAAGFDLTTHIAPSGTARVRADTEGVGRMVAVLIDNACKYAGAGGTVDVRVAVSGGKVVLTVDDSGPGIPEAHRDLVFDRFHRIDRAPGGTGLGLAIADAVVQSSSGARSIGTSPFGGARFEVTWRLAAQGVDGASSGKEPTTPGRPHDVPLGAPLGAE